jgi:hypothetical protein
MSDPTTISPARSNEEEPIVHLRLGDHEIWILPRLGFQNISV